MKHLFLIFVFIFGVAGHALAQEKTVYYFNPHWSADGKRIVFESTKDGKFAVYTISADGSNLKKLTGDESNNEQPRWSPDGKQIVFISDRTGDLRLYTMNADGSRQRRIGNTDDTDYLPEFSPKGDLLVFQSRPERASLSHDIYTIRVDGTGRTRLTDQTADYLGPRWSPNGKKILFTKTEFISKNMRDEMSKMTRDERQKLIARRNASGEIFVMDADGSNIKNLTNNDVSDGGAEWSRDGKTIYFTSERDGSRDGSPNIYAMNADGSKARKIASGDVVKDINISPDGKYFAYTKEGDKKWGLYIYEIKSGKERLLTGGN